MDWLVKRFIDSLRHVNKPIKINYWLIVSLTSSEEYLTNTRSRINITMSNTFLLKHRKNVVFHIPEYLKSLSVSGWFSFFKIQSNTVNPFTRLKCTPTYSNVWSAFNGIIFFLSTTNQSMTKWQKLKKFSHKFGFVK